MLDLEFTNNCSIIFVGSFEFRASREFFIDEVRSPEIGIKHGYDKQI
jgi:hypothetical protein